MDLSQLSPEMQKAAAQVSSGSGGLFDFSMGSLIAGIIFSGLGLIYFRYGKINHRYSTLICGILLMALPFFISNVLYLSLACIAVAVYPLFG